MSLSTTEEGIMRSLCLCLTLGLASVVLLGLTCGEGRGQGAHDTEHPAAHGAPAANVMAGPATAVGTGWRVSGGYPLYTMSMPSYGPYANSYASSYSSGGTNPYVGAGAAYGRIQSRPENPPPFKPEHTRDVTLYDTYYSPSLLAVPSGTLVRWKNRGRHHHTVTFAGSDSGDIAPGDEYSAYLTIPGTYYYYCRYHPRWMQGTITVY
jgi:plastocyanin